MVSITVILHEFSTQLGFSAYRSITYHPCITYVVIALKVQMNLSAYTPPRKLYIDQR